MSYFYQIKTEGALAAVQIQLEEEELSVYERIARQKINQPVEIFNNFVRIVRTLLLQIQLNIYTMFLFLYSYQLIFDIGADHISLHCICLSQPCFPRKSKVKLFARTGREVEKKERRLA